MITDHDIHKLKSIFAAKDDLKEFATKKDLERFATKEDLQVALSNYPTKVEFRNSIDELISLITGGFNRIEKAIDRLDEHEEMLDNHERRLDRVGDKVFT